MGSCPFGLRGVAKKKTQRYSRPPLFASPSPNSPFIFLTRRGGKQKKHQQHRDGVLATKTQTHAERAITKVINKIIVIIIHTYIHA